MPADKSGRVRQWAGFHVRCKLLMEEKVPLGRGDPIGDAAERWNWRWVGRARWTMRFWWASWTE